MKTKKIKKSIKVTKKDYNQTNFKPTKLKQI